MATATIDRTPARLDHRLLRTSAHRARRALAECRSPRRAHHERPAHLPRLPQLRPEDPAAEFVRAPAERTHLGGWLAGGVQWHFTFMWIFVGSGLLYIVYQIVSGHWRQVLFLPRDIKGVWPMARHYFLFGNKPPVEAAYNPLQKLAYTSTLFFGVMSTLTGLVMYKPVQFWWIAWPMGGYHYARIWHFLSMLGFVAFIPATSSWSRCTAGTISTR